MLIVSRLISCGRSKFDDLKDMGHSKHRDSSSESSDEERRRKHKKKHRKKSKKKYYKRDSSRERDRKRTRRSSSESSEDSSLGRGSYRQSKKRHKRSRSRTRSSSEESVPNSRNEERKVKKEYKEQEALKWSSNYDRRAEVKDIAAQHCSDEAPGSSLKHEKNKSATSDSEDDLMFEWEHYRYEINQIFSNDDIIRRGTTEYDDFWKFLKKYQGLQKQKTIRQMCGNKQYREEMGTGEVSSVYKVPQHFDKRYNINFALNVTTDDFQRRLPIRDLDEDKRSLSRKRLTELKFIILLYLDFLQKQRFEKLKKLRETQANLPISNYKEEIISKVSANNVVIIAGDTGCGKSTQVPQYLLAAGYANIACTQPRRIACISLSKRVAYETLNEFGSKVGYQIRFEKNKTEHTKIVFLTEGLLLRQVASDPLLSMYDVMILDEIHERHLHTDFLLGVIKCLVMQREDIKVVLMSATINLDLFRNYFMGKAPVVQVPGRLYPIKLQYFPIPVVEQASKTEKLNPAPYVRILQLIDKKYPDDERGDLLIFLSGMSEISTVVEAVKLYGQQTGKWIVLPLHSTLSVSEQEKVFDVPPEGIRKCIVSTNIAETSVTIDGVRFVIDSGKVKEMSFDAQSKMRKLKEFWISQASAEQRKGRAGRTGPGTCFRLYTDQEYSQFSQYSTPEIQRVPLDSLVLQMISMGLPNVRLFPFIEPPAQEQLENAVQSLKAHAAITEAEGVTTIGNLLSQLPMDISLGKMLIMGSLFHQVEPVLSLAAAMSVQSPFTNRARRDPDCEAFIKTLQSDHGDPFTLLASYREWLYIKQNGHENSRKWCKRRGLEEQRFYEMTKLRHQFSQLLRESGLQEVAGCARAPLTSAERAQRSGHLRQLHDLKRELYKDGPRKVKVLKVSHGEEVVSDEEDNRTDIKDVDFRIKNDQKQLSEIYRSCKIHTLKDIIMMKIIICSGLYPNVAIADEHNNYKPGSEQLFHTFAKPFTVLHPNSVFSSQPEVLQIADSDIIEYPGFSLRNPLCSKHQFLVYVSLLETNKPYLVDSVRVPSAQLLLLFAQSIDTNADMTVMAFDNFIELKFPDAMSAQNLLFQAVQLRSKWKYLLDLRIQISKPTIDNRDRLITDANKLEKDLSVGLIDFFLTDALYAKRRLLAADIAVLHVGPGAGDCILSGNPFSKEASEVCQTNNTKGGVDLTEYLTYNSLFDTDCSVTTITSYDTVCPYCDKEFHVTTLGRLSHMSLCLEGLLQSTENVEEEEQHKGDDPTKKKFFCDVCQQTMWLGIKDIFKHKKICK